MKQHSEDSFRSSIVFGRSPNILICPVATLQIKHSHKVLTSFRVMRIEGRCLLNKKINEYYCNIAELNVPCSYE
jgi:hypothetical protein